MKLHACGQHHGVPLALRRQKIGELHDRRLGAVVLLGGNFIEAVEQKQQSGRSRVGVEAFGDAVDVRFRRLRANAIEQPLAEGCGNDVVRNVDVAQLVEKREAALRWRFDRLFRGVAKKAANERRLSRSRIANHPNAIAGGEKIGVIERVLATVQSVERQRDVDLIELDGDVGARWNVHVPRRRQQRATVLAQRDARGEASHEDVADRRQQTFGRELSEHFEVTPDRAQHDVDDRRDDQRDHGRPWVELQELENPHLLNEGVTGLLFSLPQTCQEVVRRENVRVFAVEIRE